MIEPEKLNYDLPIIFLNLAIEDESKIVTARKMAIEWVSINEIMEYPKEYEEEVDWKQHKNEDKVWITFKKRTVICLGNFDELLKLWQYYLKEVKLVDTYQISNTIRKAMKDGKED